VVYVPGEAPRLEASQFDPAEALEAKANWMIAQESAREHVRARYVPIYEAS
jgi:hypothetical protein